VLEVRALVAGYGDVEVLRGFDLAVPAGAIIALVGANGAGKTTLAKAIAGLLPARAGTILWAGEAVERLSPRRRLERGIVLVPEGRQIIAGLSVAENLRLGAYALRRDLGEAGIAARMGEACRRFPALGERLGETAGNLSGGQQQMLAIARAMMARPQLLILDEPSLGLAPALVRDIFALIEEMRRDGLAILLSEQNARLSLAIADHAYVIERGAVALEGTGRDLLGRPEFAERYLGMGKGAASAATEAAERHAALVSGLRRILAL